LLQNACLFQILYVLADRNCKSSVLTKSKFWKRAGDKRETCFARICLWQLELPHPACEEMERLLQEKLWPEPKLRCTVVQKEV